MPFRSSPAKWRPRPAPAVGLRWGSEVGPSQGYIIHSKYYGVGILVTSFKFLNSNPVLWGPILGDRRIYFRLTGGP